MVVGISLVLHTAAWMLLLWCNVDEENNDGNIVVAWLSYFVLEWVPWTVSIGWTLFVAYLFLFMGFAKVSGKME